VQVPPSRVREPKEGLSIQTLVIAAIASGVAAIVVSRVWEQGTVLASAMTPVLVAVVSEMLKKPVESERVRSGVRNVSSVSRPRSGRTPKVLAPPPRGVDDPPPTDDDSTEAGPLRVYSSGTNKRPRLADTPRRKLHLKIAVITGLIGFLIAAAALTLPELVFGGPVGGGDRGTTYFGGGDSSKEKGESQDGNSQDGQPDEPTDQNDPEQDPEAPVSPGGDGEQEDPAPTPEQPTPPTPTTPPEAPTQPPPETPGGSTAP
jgi:hypothetical protein